MVAFGHHTIETMDNARADEDAGAASPRTSPAATATRARSTPIHRAAKGKKTVAALFEATRT